MCPSVCAAFSRSQGVLFRSRWSSFEIRKRAYVRAWCKNQRRSTVNSNGLRAHRLHAYGLWRPLSGALRRAGRRTLPRPAAARGAALSAGFLAIATGIRVIEVHWWLLMDRPGAAEQPNTSARAIPRPFRPFTAPIAVRDPKSVPPRERRPPIKLTGGWLGGGKGKKMPNEFTAASARASSVVTTGGLPSPLGVP